MRSRKRLLLALALLSVTTLGGCATTGSLGTSSDSVPCESLAPITWSHKDTKETVRQVVGYNAVGKSLCKEFASDAHTVGFSWDKVLQVGSK